MKNIYISSTYVDLKQHRRAVYDALRKMQFDVKAMEDYVARDNRLVSQCIEDVQNSDCYVGIFAWRYGTVPKKDNPEQLSISELEYRAAVAAGVPTLIFILHEDASWPKTMKDSQTGENDGARITQLRIELAETMHSLFSDEKDLVEAAMASVHLAQADARARSLPKDMGNADLLTMNSSYYSEIRDRITEAITDARVDVLSVDLADGTAWWSTRLALLAALAADFTEIGQIVFEADQGYLGMCKPLEVRRALARSFVNIESAYRDSLPSPDEESPDKVAVVHGIVDRFSQRMDEMGGEDKLKTLVRPDLVRDWGRMSRTCVELPSDSVTTKLLRRVVECKGLFVALVRGTRLVTVVDRTTLATQLALAQLEP